MSGELNKVFKIIELAMELKSHSWDVLSSAEGDALPLYCGVWPSFNAVFTLK